MTDTPTLLPPPPPPPVPTPRPTPGGRIVRIVVIVLGVLSAAFIIVLAVSFYLYGRAPAFDALRDSPDRSLHGTIAYVSPGEDPPCLQVTLASGAAAKTLQCYDRQAEGWPTELVWLDDGRLQATAFAEVPYRQVRWQRIYDLRTGSVTEVPLAAADSTRPVPPSSLKQSGARITTTSNEGHVELVVSGPGGTRTLLSADGGGGYRLADDPVWSPDQRWILVGDSTGRLLVTTADPPSVTRELATQHGEILAISGADLLVDPGP